LQLHLHQLRPTGEHTFAWADAKGKGVPTSMSTMAAVAGRPKFTPAAYEPGVPKSVPKRSKRSNCARVRRHCGQSPACLDFRRSDNRGDRGRCPGYRKAGTLVSMCLHASITHSIQLPLGAGTILDVVA